MSCQILSNVPTHFFTACLLACFVLSTTAHSENEKSNPCDALVEGKWFSDEPRSAAFLIGELKEREPLVKQTRALQETLRRVGKNRARRPWISGFKVLAALPQNIEQAQYFGYNLIHVILKSIGFKPPQSSAIYVSTKSLSMEEIVSRVYDEAGIGPRSTKAREKIDSQVEMIAATIGSPADRMVLESQFLERTGSFADMVGADLGTIQNH